MLIKSSLKIKTFLFLIKIFESCSISFLEYPAPVGLDGEFKISHFVFLDMAFFNFSGVFKPFFLHI